MKRLFEPHTPQSPARSIIFMSGYGSNAEAVLKYVEKKNNSTLKPMAIATDAPETSRAVELGERFSLPVVALDIRKFYLERGEESILLNTPHRREIRQEWSEEFWKLLKQFSPELGLLAGFVPLTNLTGKIPCLNVHPGDLTICDADGSRMLAGLHILPVERAILAGHGALRSSVILAQPYTGDASGDIDSGPVLGVSEPLPLDLEGMTIEELQETRAKRVPGVKPSDKLRMLAEKSVEKLKYAGDHIVFPLLAEDFASGCFYAEGNRVGFSAGEGMEIVNTLTVEYRADGSRRFLEQTI